MSEACTEKKKVLAGKFFKESGRISGQILAGLVGQLEKKCWTATALNPAGYPARFWPDCDVAAVQSVSGGSFSRCSIAHYIGFASVLTL